MTFEFSQAPIAYSLSALSAGVYIFATIALASRSLRRLARPALWLELVGVLSVGTLSFLAPHWFNHPSVWSGYGIGYGFIPLVLPVIGFAWLRKINA
jgi:hypothetical protein